MPIPQQQLLEAIAQLERRYTDLEHQAAELAGQTSEPLPAPPLLRSAKQSVRGQAGQHYQEIAKELSDLRELAMTYRTYRSVERDAAEAEAIFHAQGDLDLREMAKDEAASLHLQQAELLSQLQQFWAERHEEPQRPIIVEIRAGTGGQEASLFVSDLYRMYTKYAAKYGLRVEPMESQRTESGGLKEIAFAVRGSEAWQRFKYESGVHRVQRVPETEAQGRIHTSTITVAVLPEPEEVDLPPIPGKDLQLDVYRSSGPGGQGVNTTDSAVRIRHIPTGLMVTCQDERSQLRNKEKAMRVLRARLLDRMQQEKTRQIASTRRQQVGSAERSEKIRTYNFPDRRVTDHRSGLTLRKLDAVMEGELQDIIESLVAQERAKDVAAP